jgi:molybdate transport system substrate-binding protein
MTIRRRVFLGRLMASWAAVAGGAAQAQESRPALIAAAASVQGAMDEIAAAWIRDTGQRLHISYGSSGNLVRQIQQGLPAELFLSADEGFALKLAEAGLARDSGVVYASGRLVLVVPKASTLKLDPQLQGLKAGWASVRKFAIANPELAPYGKAAREVLQTAGLWERAQDKLVLGENIGQATQFVTTGAAQAGITALSLLTESDAGRASRYIALPDSLHAPLRQRMVLLKQARPAAVAFYQHLQTPAAGALLRKHGFAVE